MKSSSMGSHSSTSGQWRPPTVRLILLSLVPIIGFGQCTGESQRMASDDPNRPGHPGDLPAYAIDQYKLDLALNPKLHRLEASAELTIQRQAAADQTSPGRIRIELHRDLGIDTITCAGRPVGFRRLADDDRSGAPKDDDSDDMPPPPAVYVVGLPDPRAPRTVLIMRYGGLLFQNVSAGEKPGEIHNRAMHAHVGPDGIYLAPEGAWYPRIADPDRNTDRDPTRETQAADFQLSVAHLPGMTLVACGNRSRTGPDDASDKHTWRTPFPFDGMALVGGPLQNHQRTVNGLPIRVLLREDHAHFAEAILNATESYIKLYQPLIGKYPYDEFTVVENFFSSGFAFPGFTVLSSAVIGMGEMGLRPGYLDHELLHNWWGNGVNVSALDGNWCECLTSYCANYMRPVLEGDTIKARAQRRDICYGLSRIAEDKDKPLGRFGRKDGPSSFIGYQKGSMVFAMLAQRIGADTLWQSLKELYTRRLGKPTGWADIQRTVEQVSGRSLDRFFQDWVRESGVPDVRIDEADYNPQEMRLTITTLQQGPHVFDLTLPIRLIFRNATLDETITVNRAAQVSVIRSLEPPQAIEVDPEFLVLRRIPLDHLMPTLAGIGKSKPLTIVAAEDDFKEYDAVAGALRRRYKDADEADLKEIKAADLNPDDLTQGHALLLGKACLTPAAGELLTDQPLSIGDGFFTVGATRHDKPGDAVLCCLRNKSDPGGVICLYYGNGIPALRKASLITFYGGNSLIVFHNGAAGQRLDFERPQRIPVTISP